jgi:outer membrane protein TolC
MARPRVVGWLGLLALVAAGARAEEVVPPPVPRAPFRFSVLPDQWRPDVPPSAALGVPGAVVRDELVERVTLKEAIALALVHNPGIAAERLEPTRLRAGVLAEQGRFDPAFAAELESRKSEIPNASALGGTAVSRIDERFANFHLMKLFRSGTQFSVDFLNDRLDTNSRFNTLRPQYTPELGFSLVQPLLRNLGWNFTYLVVRVAEETADAGFYQYEAALADFVQQVIEAYWSVVRAQENLEVQRESRALADRTVEENEARVRVGLLPPVAVLEARADAMARAEQVILAENDLRVSRQRLAQLAYYRPADTVIPRTLEPVEEATPEEVTVDIEGTLATALERRPEIHASARGITARQLDEKAAANQLLPRVDLLGSYGHNGLSGTARCVQFGGTVTCEPPFAGSKTDAYERLKDFRSYAFGFQVQVPFANAAAEGQHAQARIARDQAELGHRDLLSRVTLEVEQSVSDMASSRQRIDTSRIARELAEENLRNQEKRHEVGMATTKDLLDFQTRLTSARAAEVQAKIDYAIAVARWRRSKGELLPHYQVVIEHPKRRGAPWFAWF